MAGPIQALRAGAARIGSGDLSQRISVKTGDDREKPCQERIRRRLGAYDLKQHLDIATRGVRIGTDFLMRLFRQSCEIRLRDGPVLDVQLDSEAKAAALARTDRYRTDHLRLGRVLLVLLGNVVERAPEAGGVTRGEEMFRRRGARPARSAHSLRHRQVGPDHPVARLGMSVTATGCGCSRGEERFDFVHGRLSK
jgi:hypothetical protein